MNFTKFRRIRTKKRAISKEDIMKIERLELIENSSLLNVKNYFLFSYYCMGINFIDIANLKWENIKNERLEYTRLKTKEDFSVALMLPAIKILDYYKKLAFDENNTYIFPILSNIYKTPQSIEIGW